jgi:hypothetical protein
MAIPQPSGRSSIMLEKPFFRLARDRLIETMKNNSEEKVEGRGKGESIAGFEFF